MKNRFKNKIWYFLPIILVFSYVRPVLGAGDLCSLNPSGFLNLKDYISVLLICSIGWLMILAFYILFFVPGVIGITLAWKSRNKIKIEKNKFKFWAFIAIWLQVAVAIIFFLLNKVVIINLFFSN